MTNHFHLRVETVDGNLSRGICLLKGYYIQNFNCHHGLVGHLFQGCYKVILVQKESYLLDLTRYVVLNSVRAGRVKKPEDWPWSSCRAMIGVDNVPEWLDTDRLLSQFGKQRKRVVAAYQCYVMEGKERKGKERKGKGIASPPV